MADNVTTAAETNLITAEQMKKVREIDFVRQFQHNSLSKLLEVLGVTRRIPMMEGTTLKVYKMTGTLEDGNVAEGELIPLSKYEQEPVDVGPITLKKWRKAATAESIAKSGYETAVRETDAALLRDVQVSVRTDLFGILKSVSGSNAIDGGTPTTATGATLQEALAQAWGQLQVKFEDDTAEAVFFVNPLDIADYLGAANITTQTTFGMNYVENFMGLGTVIMSAQIEKGTFIATAKRNFIAYYITVNGDVARSFHLTSDELGLIGINSGGANTERAQVETLVISGVRFLVEYAEGVVKGTISGG